MVRRHEALDQRDGSRDPQERLAKRPAGDFGGGTGVLERCPDEGRRSYAI